MAYEKYIKKDGKIYGPYIYHSKRVDGKVISEYHGQKKIDFRKAVFILPIIVLLALGVYLIGHSQKKLTGNAVLDLNANYQEGQILDGSLKLSMNSGELMPADSSVVFENAGQKYQYALKDLVSDETANGTFFMDGKNLSGSGPGFGIPGTKQVYPDVFFILIISSKNQTEVHGTEQKNTEAQTGEGNATQTENSSGILNSISNLFLGLTPTGNAIVEFQKEVEGTASFGNPFIYTLQPGETAEIKPTSVRSGDSELPENTISLAINGDTVSVSTNYSQKEKGFGPGYEGESKKDITINLNNLNLSLQKGDLTVGVFYGGEQLNSISTSLGEGKVAASATVQTTETSRNTSTETNIPETNIPEEIQRTNISTIDINQVIELTDQEKAVLHNGFGNTSAQITQATEKNGFITIKYELGDYWIEHSYDANLSQSELQTFIQQDKIKFLKDIAANLSAQDVTEKNLPGLTGNYP